MRSYEFIHIVLQFIQFVTKAAMMMMIARIVATKIAECWELRSWAHLSRSDCEKEDTIIVEAVLNLYFILQDD